MFGHFIHKYGEFFPPILQIPKSLNTLDKIFLLAETQICGLDAKKYGFGEGYIYTHAAPNIEQQFMPDEITDVKYLEEN